MNSAQVVSFHAFRLEKRLAKAMSEHFDNPTYSDLKFLVDGKTIHVHKTILKFQCEYFRVMFQVILLLGAELSFQ